jgi:hypothetical protein
VRRFPGADADRNQYGIIRDHQDQEGARRGKMIQGKVVVDLSESRRKELFNLLVVAQDYAMSVAEARQMACNLFGLAESQVVRIEREGLERTWPPL